MSAKNVLMVMDFAEWLKTNRTKSKLSLRRLADRINNICSDAYLSQLENRRYLGKKGEPMRPDKEIVLALADVFRENPDVALNLAGYPSENIPNLPEFLYKKNWNILTLHDLYVAEKFIDYLIFEKAENERILKPDSPIAFGDEVDEMLDLDKPKKKKRA